MGDSNIYLLSIYIYTQLDLGMFQFQTQPKKSLKKPKGVTKGIWGIHAWTRDLDTQWYSIDTNI